MMGIFSQAGSHIRRARGLSVEDRAPEDTEPDDTSILCVLGLFSSTSSSLSDYTTTPHLYPLFLLLAHGLHRR